MHSKITTFLIFISVLVPVIVTAQDVKPCSTDEMYFELLENNPSEREEILKAKQQLEEFSQYYIKHRKEDKSDSVYIIPVVFHVLHQGGQENISDEQIRDAVKVVNQDFRKMNRDTNLIVDEFKSVAADARIEIRLAKTDPNGNCTNGIDRILSSRTNSADDSSKLNQWPREKYLNVWVVKSIGSGAAGYAFYPHSTIGNNSYRDGIVILSHYMGSIGTSAPNRSRTLTHEIGHYLNLPHTWGSSNSPGEAGNCNMDDGISDTPLTMGNTTCNLAARTCDGTLDNVQNYMEYSYCTNMFTYGQAAKMHATLNSSLAGRSNLHSQQNLIATGVLTPGTVCEADFESDKNFACINDTVTFVDQSYHNPQNWLWNIEGAQLPFHSDSIIHVSYPNEGVYDAFLLVSDSTGTVSEAKEDYIYIFDTIADYKSMGYLQEFEDEVLPQEWLYIPSIYNNRFKKADVGYESSSSVYVDNFNASGLTEYYDLISPAFDLSSLVNPKLIFQYAFTTRKSTNNDKLEIFTSDDCGKNWDIQFTYSGNPLSTAPSQANTAFVPDSNQWRRFAIPFNSKAKFSDNVLVKFRFTSDGGNNFYLDNINIDGLVGIKEIDYLKNVYLYPNPSNGKTHLRLELISTESVNIKVFDIQGKKVKEMNMGRLDAGKHIIPIDIENYTNGMFFVNVNISDSSSTFKLVKQ